MTIAIDCIAKNGQHHVTVTRNPGKPDETVIARERHDNPLVAIELAVIAARASRTW